MKHASFFSSTVSVSSQEIGCPTGPGVFLLLLDQLRDRSMNSVHLSPRARHVVLALALLAWFWTGAAREVVAQGPTRSSPIALTTDDRFVWAVNRENNSVSVLEVGNDLNQKVREIKVGVEPRAVAITPDNQKVYVTNMVSGTVSVINASTYTQLRVIPVGTEPFGCALTPDGTKLYVANFSSDTVSVINTTTDKVTATIALSAGNNKPRALAVSTDNKVYVTSFLAHLRSDGRR